MIKEISLSCLSYIPESRSGNDTSGIHVKGTLHWVSVKHAITCEVRLYDRLFKVEILLVRKATLKIISIPIHCRSLKLLMRNLHWKCQV